MEQQTFTYNLVSLPGADFGAHRSDRIEAAIAAIRNALVPLQIVADVLHRPYDAKSRDWCVRMLGLEVKRIVAVLDTL